METTTKTGIERVIETKSSPRWSITIAGSSIFAAISILFAVYVKFLPRVQWGLALFDPVSLIWILAFFIFGYKAGILTSVLGMTILMFTDDWTPIGPLMKFTATIPLILIPILTKIIMKKAKTGEVFFKPSNIVIDWIISVIIRSIIMIIFNVVVINLMFGGDAFAASIDLAFLGLPSITGWMAIYLTVGFINILQSVWDYLIPYAITKLIQQNNNLILW